MSATSPPYPGPVWQREGYASAEEWSDDAYRKLFGHEPPPLPTTRTRRIARLELAGVTLTLTVGQSALKISDGLDDRGQVPGKPSLVTDWLLHELCDVLHKLSGNWHVGGNRARNRGAEVVGSGRDAGSVAEVHESSPSVGSAVTASVEGERPGAVEAAPAPGHPIEATFELAPDDAATVLDWIRGTEGGAE
ncbi:hypothetical protein [Mycobacteroides abscessus]|uniref:hypothetical protein n=1 Tax=Mycobacteroides abscessus TaxID=36809 RepID=UPI000941DC0F|nr:hypothetical protein [Mycobacteroides abscessus]